MKKYSRSAKIVPFCLKRSPVEVLRRGLGLGCVSLPGSAAACRGLARGPRPHAAICTVIYLLSSKGNGLACSSAQVPEGPCITKQITGLV